MRSFSNKLIVDSDVQFYDNYLTTLNSSESVQAYKDYINALLKGIQPQTILDVGCGSGYDTDNRRNELPNTQFVGIDTSFELASIASQKFDLMATGDVRKLPFRDDSFSSLCCDRVLQHIADARSVLSEIRRVANNSGLIIIADTDWNTVSFGNSSQVDDLVSTYYLNKLPGANNIPKLCHYIQLVDSNAEVEERKFLLQFTDPEEIESLLGPKRILRQLEHANAREEFLVARVEVCVLTWTNTAN